MPVVTDPTIIDASTQPGFAGTPIVVVDGSRVIPTRIRQVRRPGHLRRRHDGAWAGHRRQAPATASSSRGKTGSRIVDTDVRDNGEAGILITGSAANTIGGTTAADRVVASANGVAGIELTDGSSGNVIEGSFLGTDAIGRVPLGNGQDGVFIDGSPDNTVGGIVAGSRNVISANGEVEVQIHGASLDAQRRRGRLPRHRRHGGGGHLPDRLDDARRERGRRVRQRRAQATP